MQKRLIQEEELDILKIKGMKEISGMVGKTLGPQGRSILSQREGQALDGTPLKPRITKDGVSVANDCSSPDPGIDIIIQTVKAICQKTNADAGDGTTTAIVLGYSILREAMFEADSSKLSPQQIKNSLDEAGKEVIKELESMAWPVSTFGEIREVATLASNGDVEVGEIIAKAFQAVGAEGVVTVDEGMGVGLELEKVNGYRFQRGAQGREGFFNNASLTAYEVEDAAIILFDGTIRSHTDLIPLLMKLAQVDQDGISKNPPPPIVIIANEFSRDAIQWMLIQKSERGVAFCPVIGPNITHIRTQYYDDLAAYTGGTRLGNGNKNLPTIIDSDIGRVKKVIIDKYKTTFFTGGGGEKAILARVDALKVKRDKAESPYDKQGISDRIASLTGGIAKILIGGVTEVEIKERYDRVEDAINASRAAIREGVVLGGGVALLRIASKFHRNLEKHKNIGEKILSLALKAPFWQILDNVGLELKEKEDIDLKLVTSLENTKLVYDANKGVLINAVEAGILDPVSVTRAAFKNALSISGLLLTAGGAIIMEDLDDSTSK